MEESNISLSDLAGVRTLTGCDTSIEKIESYGGYLQDAQCVRFCLDGVNYTAIEDENDGYRSCLGSLFVGGEISNVFPPIAIRCKYLTRRKCDFSDGFVECGILVCVDIVTGLTVLEIGTDNTDDYYPSFVSCFSPQNMVTNT